MSKKILKSLPALVFIVLPLELLPIPLMLLDYIQVMIQEGGINGILTAFAVFILMVIAGIILFILISLGIGLLDTIWGDKNHEDYR